MTTKIISNYYGSGYTISAGVTVLTIEGGGVGGPGVIAGSSALINNYATVSGIEMTAGGTVKNNAVVSGSSGHSVNITGGAGLIDNYGSIEGAGVLITGTVVNSRFISAVTLTGGGLVDNKALAVIGGITAIGAAGTVDNYGDLISATNGFGVNLKAGGTVRNGVFGVIYADVGVSIAGAAGVVKNYGTILAYPNGQGIDLVNGGTVSNGSTGDTRAVIQGANVGVYGAGATTTVTNFGTIQATEQASNNFGVALTHGGVVINGGSSDWTATISGYTALAIEGGAATVTNFGSIIGSGNPPGTGGDINAAGVDLLVSGDVTNGSVTDRAALITGAYNGIEVTGTATISNFGIIEGTSTSAAAGSEGIQAYGGKVTNGALGDQAALIVGYSAGVSFDKAAGTVINFGTVETAQTIHSAAVVLVDGGSVTNGAVGDTAALLSGCYGVYFKLAATVTNFGTIEGAFKFGVTAVAGGTVTNGVSTDTRALIEGSTGVVMSAALGTITNFGTLHGLGAAAGYAGISLAAAGKITNGALGDRVATIDGYTGLIAAGTALSTVVNFATINGVGQAGQSGAVLKAGGALNNGAATDSAALIEGYVGVTAAGITTVTNFGTIEGQGGVAVQFQALGDVLVDEAGSTFLGTALGDGGTLTLAGVGGAFSGFSPAAGSTFQNFGTINVATGASFTLTGAANLAAAAKLVDSGALSIGATGSLTSLGAISGAGALIIAGGAATIGAGLTVASVSLANPASTVNVTKTLTYAGVWTQSAGTLTVAGGSGVNFSGVGDSFSGTIAGGGTVNFTAGTDTLSNVTLAAATSLKSSTVNLSGAINFAGVVTATSAGLTVAAGGATLTGGGSLSLASVGGAIIKGATSAATLTNVNNRILGAGLLGDGVMTLVNDLAGVIDASGSAAMVINTGANTITNAGLIETVGAGGLTISSALANTGTLTLTTGVMSVTGAITGAGTVRISGGAADFAAAFAENVTFAGTTGVLELGQSQGYTGQISGFSKTGGTSLDLLDIAFGASTTAKFSGTATSGVLTVTDGTHTAKITLLGNYTASTFTVSAGVTGGTSVVDPSAGRAPPALPLITAMAGFASAPAASLLLGDSAPSNTASLLVRP